MFRDYLILHGTSISLLKIFMTILFLNSTFILFTKARAKIVFFRKTTDWGGNWRQNVLKGIRPVYKPLSGNPERGLHPCKMVSAHAERGLHPREMVSARAERGLYPCKMVSARAERGLHSCEMVSARAERGLHPRGTVSASAERGFASIRVNRKLEPAAG
jgi:hypothetical protein